MTPAGFDTLRRSLGLTKREAAAVCGNVTERTVSRWQSGDVPLPDDAVEALEQLEDAMLATVDQTVRFATDQVAEGPVELLRYRSAEHQATSAHAADVPAGAHAMMIGWIADALAAEGIDVSIEWAP